MTTRKFEDKSITLVRRSLKLYEFSRVGYRKSSAPTRIVELTDDELRFRSGFSTQDVPTPTSSPPQQRTTNRVEVGAVRCLPKDESEDEELLYTEELAPSVYVTSRSAGPWPVRTPMARTGFTVHLTEVDCGKQLRRALTRAGDYCFFKRFAKGTCLISLHDGDPTVVVGTARAMYTKFVSEEDSSDGETEDRCAIYLDVELASPPSVQKTLLLLFACIRYHFEMYIREENRGKVSTSTTSSTALEGSRSQSSVQAAELLGRSEDRLVPEQKISSSLKLAASRVERRRRSTACPPLSSLEDVAGKRESFRKSCLCSLKIEKLLLECSALIEDLGHEFSRVEKGSSYELRVVLLAAEEREIPVVVSARRPSSGKLWLPTAPSQLELTGVLPRKRRDRAMVSEFWEYLDEEFGRRNRRTLRLSLTRENGRYV